MLKYLWILPLEYISLFAIFFLLKIYVYPKLFQEDNPLGCPVCQAYMTALIIGFFLDFPTKILIFMVGMSVTGISYRLDYFKVFKEVPFIILQLLITIIGLVIILNIIGG